MQARAQVYEEAFRKIKEATGVSDVNEVVQKIFSQEDQQRHLGELTKENQARVERMTGELLGLKAQVEELKYNMPGGRTGARKMVDGIEEKVGAAMTRLTRAKDKYERLARILISVKSGIDHLVEKLTSVMPCAPGGGPRLRELSDDTIVDVMYSCEKTLVDVMARIRSVPRPTGAESTGPGDAHGGRTLASPPAAGEGLGSLGILEGDITSTRIYNTRIDVDAAAGGAAAAERAAQMEDDSGGEVCGARRARVCGGPRARVRDGPPRAAQEVVGNDEDIQGRDQIKKHIKQQLAAEKKKDSKRAFGEAKGACGGTGGGGLA